MGGYVCSFMRRITRVRRLIAALFLVLANALALLSPVTVHAASVTANVFTDPTPGQCATTGTGNCSLREAVIYANAHAGTTINLLNGMYMLTIGPDMSNSMSAGDLKLYANVTITGAGSGATIIDASGMAPRDRVFFVDRNVTVAMRGVTIRGGFVSGYGSQGGGIESDGTLTLTDCLVTTNTAADGQGGGILQLDNALSIIDSEVSNNISGDAAHTGDSVSHQGGGLEVYDANLTVIRSRILHNTADTGGGIYASGPGATLTDSVVENNQAIRDGGGIYTDSPLVISHSAVGDSGAGNTAGQNGGGIASETTRAVLTIQEGSVITGNAATNGAGGGIYNTGGSMGIIGSTISQNTANGAIMPSIPITASGGGIYNDATASLTDSTVTGNTTSSSGGGIDNEGIMYIIRDTISNNRTVNNGFRGGGAYVAGPNGQLTLLESTVSSNTSSDGAAVANVGGILDITKSNIGSNVVTAGYAGVVGNFGANASLTVTDTMIHDNHGAGVINSTTAHVISSTITGNSQSGLENNGGALLDVVNSTISDNTTTGGGFNNPGAMVTLTNDTVVGNSVNLSAPSSPHIPAGTITVRNTLLANGGTNCMGNIVSGDYNLSSDASCTALTQPHDLMSTLPLIGPLADNGGPTSTHALLPGSPAIDAGGTSANGCPTTDQRGVTRPQGAACDIGAFEAGATPTDPTPTLTALSPATGSSGGGTAVTITGTGFAPGIVVSFGGATASQVQVVNSTTLTVVTPAHVAGDVTVTVTNQHQAPGTSGASLPNAYRYVDPAPLMHPGGATTGTMSQPQPVMHQPGNGQGSPSPVPNPHTNAVATPTAVMPTPAPQPVRH